ncbi:SDR family oxidoreductase [Patescibacteria group bacterium]|nr:SDR family oxidoreductase [Patescibacteria group bacterium]
MKLKDKVAVVTGAAGGIGSTFVKELDKENVDCVLIEKDEESVKRLISSLQGKNHSYFICDFRRTSEILRLVKKIKRAYKKIDLLINVAGIGVYKSIEDIRLSEWEDSLAINLTSPFLLIKKLIPLLNKSESPLVINVGSGAGIMPFTNRVAYCSSKYGLRGMTLTLAKEYEGRKLEFCLITLGSVMTNFGPLSIEDRKKGEKKGKSYFVPEWVAKKLVGIIKDNKREVEIVLFPSNYEEEVKISTWL